MLVRRFRKWGPAEWRIWGKLLARKAWLERAILAIQERQTQDEHAARQTRYKNGRGWNKTDANRGAELAALIRDRGWPLGDNLTNDERSEALGMLRKYVAQLVRAARERGAAV